VDLISYLHHPCLVYKEPSRPKYTQRHRVQNSPCRHNHNRNPCPDLHPSSPKSPITNPRSSLTLSLDLSPPLIPTTPMPPCRSTSPTVMIQTKGPIILSGTSRDPSMTRTRMARASGRKWRGRERRGGQD
jgi:hypothetical protein